jgi:succinoglycan biosynthesis protein ExoM
MHVSVVIPTMDRTLLLQEALNSVTLQILPPWLDMEILVIDNSQDGSASSCCTNFGAQVRYIHEPTPGVSRARNRGISEAQGDVIVFLDDDERAEPDWLAEICKILYTTQADAAFGSVEPEFERDSELIDYARNIYRRRIYESAGTDVSNFYYLLGTGNSGFVKSKCFSENEPFSAKFNFSGGEDVYFLKTLVKRGQRLVWAPNARVSELVPASRCCFDYLLMKRFRSSQVRCRILWGSSIRDFIVLLMLMIAGLGQAFLGLARFLIAKLSSQPKKSNEHLITAAAGAGKFFWYLGTRQRAYN